MLVYRHGNSFEGADHSEKVSVMPEHDGLLRIFWPLDIPKSYTPGVLVGWKNSDFDVSVVAVLEEVEVRMLLSKIYSSS